jgi:GNAT superfamily N-acetyltransferase
VRHVTFAEAAESDAAAIAALRNAAADGLTLRFGKGHWSGQVTERGVRNALRDATLVVGRAGRRMVAVARLGTRKPWAIDATCFTPCSRPLYLTDMAVDPHLQGTGIGRSCVAAVIRLAEEWPADAIRLDAYDGAAGAGRFYEKCGFVGRGGAVYRGTALRYYELLLTRGGHDASPLHSALPAGARREHRGAR